MRLFDAADWDDAGRVVRRDEVPFDAHFVCQEKITPPAQGTKILGSMGGYGHGSHSCQPVECIVYPLLEVLFSSFFGSKGSGAPPGRLFIMYYTVFVLIMYLTHCVLWRR